MADENFASTPYNEGQRNVAELLEGLVRGYVMGGQLAERRKERRDRRKQEKKSDEDKAKDEQEENDKEFRAHAFSPTLGLKEGWAAIGSQPGGEGQLRAQWKSYNASPEAVEAMLDLFVPGRIQARAQAAPGPPLSVGAHSPFPGGTQVGPSPPQLGEKQVGQVLGPGTMGPGIPNLPFGLGGLEASPARAAAGAFAGVSGGLQAPATPSAIDLMGEHFGTDQTPLQNLTDVMEEGLQPGQAPIRLFKTEAEKLSEETQRANLETLQRTQQRAQVLADYQRSVDSGEPDDALQAQYLELGGSPGDFDNIRKQQAIRELPRITQQLVEDPFAELPGEDLMTLAIAGADDVLSVYAQNKKIGQLNAAGKALGDVVGEITGGAGVPAPGEHIIDPRGTGRLLTAGDIFNDDRYKAARAELERLGATPKQIIDFSVLPPEQLQRERIEAGVAPTAGQELTAQGRDLTKLTGRYRTLWEDRQRVLNSRVLTGDDMVQRESELIPELNRLAEELGFAQVEPQAKPGKKTYRDTQLELIATRLNLAKDQFVNLKKRQARTDRILFLRQASEIYDNYTRGIASIRADPEFGIEKINEAMREVGIALEQVGAEPEPEAPPTTTAVKPTTPKPRPQTTTPTPGQKTTPGPRPPKGPLRTSQQVIDSQKTAAKVWGDILANPNSSRDDRLGASGTLTNMMTAAQAANIGDLADYIAGQLRRKPTGKPTPAPAAKLSGRTGTYANQQVEILETRIRNGKEQARILWLSGAFKGQSDWWAEVNNIKINPKGKGGGLSVEEAMRQLGAPPQ